MASSCSPAWPWSCVVALALTMLEDIQLRLLARLDQQFEQFRISEEGSSANSGATARGRDIGGLGALDDAVQCLAKIAAVNGTQQTLVEIIGQHIAITLATH